MSRSYSIKINPVKEIDKMTHFIRQVMTRSNKKKIIVGLSGGVDSATSFYLLKKTIPRKNIIAVHLPYLYLTSETNPFNDKNIQTIPIKPVVEIFQKKMKIDPRKDKIRLGNIMARVRMILLYDLAKKYDALVCGTENKSEHLLGYFTRYGDEASDFEPIRHLYKTQIYELAKYLGVPEKILKKKPTAGLWQGQTDEEQFGFTYEEADRVLSLHFDKKFTSDQIIKKGFENANTILTWAKKEYFKREVPYTL